MQRDDPILLRMVGEKVCVGQFKGPIAVNQKVHVNLVAGQFRRAGAALGTGSLRTVEQERRWTVTPLPRVMKPWIGSPGIG